MWLALTTLLPLLLLLVEPALAVKREDFKECSQSSFCRRLRSIATKQEAAETASPGSFKSPYSLGNAVGSQNAEGSSWTFPLSSSLYPDITFSLRIDVLAEGDGIVRIRADEVGSASQWRRYNEASRWALLDAEPVLAQTGDTKLTTKDGVSTLTYGAPEDKLSVEIVHSPFKITQFRNSVSQLVINDRSLFHMEHYRTKEVEEIEEDKKEDENDEGGAANAKQAVMKAPETEIDRSWFETEDSGMFEESWKHWKDTKPKGKCNCQVVN
jgi:alpha 1,3-glucosidase